MKIKKVTAGIITSLVLTGSLVTSSLSVGNTIADEKQKLWVTMGSDAYAGIQQLMGNQLPKYTISSLAQTDVAVTQLDPAHLDLISYYMHAKYKRCGGFMVHDSYADAVKSANEMIANKTESLVTIDYTIDQQKVVNAFLPQLQESDIRTTIDGMANFHNRYYQSDTGKDASGWIKNTWERLTNGRADTKVELYQHSRWKQPSVIMTLQGDGSTDEVVVIGGHMDSINHNVSDKLRARAPGADDNASGIATITDVIKVMMANNYKPKRTIKFMAYAAEEVGLLGSDDIAEDMKGQGANVVGVMQLDMTNYQGSSYDYALVTDYTNSAQNEFLKRLISQYLSQYTYTTMRCGYACSDHASWHRQGYAASMPFEAPMQQSNRYIHTANDTLDKSGNNANHALKFAQLATAFLVEMAKSAGDDDGDGDDQGEYKQFYSAIGFCLDVQDSKTPLANECSKADGQQWMLGNDGTMKSKRYKDSCLTVTDSSGSGGSVAMEKCAGSNSQKWTLNGDALVNDSLADRALTVYGYRQGAKVGMWYDWGQDYQRWSWK